MISRRSLLKRLAGFCAVVALAPQIAFAELPPRTLPNSDFNMQEAFDHLFGIIKARRQHGPVIDIFTDRAGVEALYAMIGETAPQSMFSEAPDTKEFEVVGVYEQLRQASGVARG